jgi:hypothetical protein
VDPAAAGGRGGGHRPGGAAAPAAGGWLPDGALMGARGADAVSQRCSWPDAMCRPAQRRIR